MHTARATDVHVELPLAPDPDGHWRTLTPHTRISPVESYPTPKRILDKALSAALLILLGPVFAFVFAAMGVAALLRRRDRGPWLYRERRISRGREFELLKFRTLRSEALDSMEGTGQEAHARLLEADEEKLTWAGKRLLKPWYLDELPQLWNVLRGEMSLVGPRPWPPSMVANQVAGGVNYRNEFIAGWTGPAQVAKGVTEPVGYAALDSDYVNRCRASGALDLIRADLRYLRRTVVVVAKGEGLRF
jgi:lipopolysaccharide/colanic/teichoic acid biosynthesis glycosyltransferase